MNNWVIYCHINKVNGKRYIGQTKLKLEERWKNGEGYKGCSLFYKAIQKYGWDNFEHIILEDNISSQEAANQKEAYYIKLYHTHVDDPECNGYNLILYNDRKEVSEITK